MALRKYDYLVIGSGAGTDFALNAAHRGKRVCLIESGPAGGTCLNRGCIPTKIMLQSAETARTVSNSWTYGIRSRLEKIDLKKIMLRVEAIVSDWRTGLTETLNRTSGLDFIIGTAVFTGEKIVQAGENEIYGDKVVLATGMYPFVPDIKGLNEISFYTSDNIRTMQELPPSIAVLGGGYIGMELASFFQALGTQVTVLEFSSALLNGLEKDLQQFFNRRAAEKMDIRTETSLLKVSRHDERIIMEISGKTGVTHLTVNSLLIAAGRRPQIPEGISLCGVELDKKGFIRIDEKLQTSHQDIYALGDCAGTPAFRHMANYQSELLSKRLLDGSSETADYSLVPFAVFTHPEIASAGLSLEQSLTRYPESREIRLGYCDTAKGRAIGEEGFAKIVLDDKSGKITGFHIAGPHASILIHELLPVMTAGLDYHLIRKTIHIHPSLSEMISFNFSESGI